MLVFHYHSRHYETKGIPTTNKEFINSSNASRWSKDRPSFKEEREGKEKEEDKEKKKKTGHVDR